MVFCPLDCIFNKKGKCQKHDVALVVEGKEEITLMCASRTRRIEDLEGLEDEDS